LKAAIDAAGEACSKSSGLPARLLGTGSLRRHSALGRLMALTCGDGSPARPWTVNPGEKPHCRYSRHATTACTDSGGHQGPLAYFCNDSHSGARQRATPSSRVWTRGRRVAVTRSELPPTGKTDVRSRDSVDSPLRPSDACRKSRSLDYVTPVGGLCYVSWIAGSGLACLEPIKSAEEGPLRCVCPSGRNGQAWAIVTEQPTPLRPETQGAARIISGYGHSLKAFDFE
jgi:hypothetical protein